MRTKTILALFLGVILFGCKNDNKEASKQELIADAQAKIFKVTISAIVKKEDDFALSYTTDGSVDFKDQPVWQHFKGSENEQQIIFNLPIDIYPTQLKFECGIKKDQEDIVLKRIILEYNGKTKEMHGEEFRLLFRPDESACSFDPSTGIIKAFVKDGQRQKPTFYPQEANLGPELLKLSM